MTKIETYELPKGQCVFCHAEHDCASSIDQDGKPSPGDMTICIDCGEWNIFDKKMRLRKPTAVEYLEIGFDSRCRAMRDAYIKSELKRLTRNPIKKAPPK